MGIKLNSIALQTTRPIGNENIARHLLPWRRLRPTKQVDLASCAPPLMQMAYKWRSKWQCRNVNANADQSEGDQWVRSQEVALELDRGIARPNESSCGSLLLCNDTHTHTHTNSAPIPAFSFIGKCKFACNMQFVRECKSNFNLGRPAGMAATAACSCNTSEQMNAL